MGNKVREPAEGFSTLLHSYGSSQLYESFDVLWGENFGWKIFHIPYIHKVFSPVWIRRCLVRLEPAEEFSTFLTFIGFFSMRTLWYTKDVLWVRELLSGHLHGFISCLEFCKLNKADVLTESLTGFITVACTAFLMATENQIVFQTLGFESCLQKYSCSTSWAGRKQFPILPTFTYSLLRKYFLWVNATCLRCLSLLSQFV